MCEPGERVKGLKRSSRCPYTRELPIIAGAVFDADGSKGGLEGGYYERGNWATLISVEEHTCTGIDIEFGRADDTARGSGQHRAFIKVVTEEGTTEGETVVGEVGRVSADLEGSPFQILTSSDGGVPVFVKATLTCTSNNGF